MHVCPLLSTTISYEFFNISMYLVMLHGRTCTITEMCWFIGDHKEFLKLSAHAEFWNIEIYIYPWERSGLKETNGWNRSPHRPWSGKDNQTTLSLKTSHEIPSHEQQSFWLPNQLKRLLGNTMVYICLSPHWCFKQLNCEKQSFFEQQYIWFIPLSLGNTMVYMHMNSGFLCYVI